MKSFCTQLMLDTGKATTNLNDSNNLIEWIIDFKTLLLDDFEIGALYNINHTALAQRDTGSVSLTGFFTLECNAMVFTNNADLISSGSRYVLSNKGTFPYISVGTIATNQVFVSYGYSQTFQLTSDKGIIRIQHYLRGNNYAIDNVTLNDPHLLSFDIYKIN